MKVLVIHTTYQFRGGEDSVVENEATLLKDNGVKVDLLKFSNTGNILQKVVLLPFNFAAYRQTLTRIRAFKPDVIHVHNLHFGGSASVLYAIKKCRIPFVMTLHNYRLLCPSATLFFNGTDFTDATTRSFSWKAVFKGVYQHSKILTFWVSCAIWLHQKLGTYQLPSKFISLGANTNKIFQESKLSFMTSRMIIKPNFCYSETPFNPSPGSYYLYIGRLSDEKGLTTLLSAFAQNKLPLKIAGAGELEQEVIRHSKQYANIEFAGNIDKAGVALLLSGARALIFPSKWLETFGMVVIEAFSKSVPVIGSDLGQLKFTIANKVNGLRFQAGDTADLIKTVDHFENLALNEKLSFRKNAFESYQNNYTPARNIAELMAIYQQVIDERYII